MARFPANWCYVRIVRDSLVITSNALETCPIKSRFFVDGWQTGDHSAWLVKTSSAEDDEVGSPVSPSNLFIVANIAVVDLLASRERSLPAQLSLAFCVGLLCGAACSFIAIGAVE